jgi:hypothetical protein
MPNRILKESICTSENIDMLSAFQETVFYRLIVNCDDYGRMDARPKLLASRLFPMKDIRVSQITDALRALSSAELVTLYEVDGKPFLQMNTWDQHQTIRAKKPKYPGIEEGVQASENICKQMQADECKCSRNPIQYESESNPNTNIRAHADEAFESFYARYPRHVDKADARKAWAKLKDSEYDSVIAGLEKWIPYFNGEEEQFIPHPATWLNKRRWESEPPKVKKQNAALKYEQTPISKTDFDALVVDLGGGDED